MGFLTVTRREGEQIRLTIDPGVDAARLLRQLLRDGITVHIGALSRSQVKVSVEAPVQMQILRTELETPQHDEL